MGKRGWTENAIQSVIEIQQKLL
ncbi:hypothetical protein GHO42_11240 [Pseudomonas sp. FSL R10-0056]|nr:MULTISPECIES: hypothetical protein [Pseudomonas]MQT67503.1 hypothetical protein [Pseudomonas sp. FSL R10-0071]MQU49716.1 hypothetical protein [Pseudomonas sp. FSL A6-1183]HBP47713.1 hypothetical protein [Pseudomonas sp.]MCH4881444.1 hypothetical protein [Pseudomonas sp. TMW22080]MDY7569584.1 hypothetical protein [Pseudomonas sp. CCC4.1]